MLTNQGCNHGHAWGKHRCDRGKLWTESAPPLPPPPLVGIGLRYLKIYFVQPCLFVYQDDKVYGSNFQMLS
jgi:hypothetical protein